MNVSDSPLKDRRIINRLCDQFEDALRNKQPMQIEDVLAQAPATVHPELLEELLLLELSYHDVSLDTLWPQYSQRFAGAGDLVVEVFDHLRAAQSQAPANVSDLAIGAEFGRYRIKAILGQGGMGVVYRAFDTILQREVALKLPRVSDHAKAVSSRFMAEARAAANVRHPNICPIYDVGDIDGRQYISMALIRGRSLSEIMNNDPRMSETDVAKLVATLADSLETAHVNGVVHRDLKPANIMIDENREPIIMDFGLARRESDGEARLTRTGAIMGTPSYMSPEQVEGLEAGPASDIFSLGVVVFELATGRLPFVGSIGKVMADILGTHPPNLSDIDRRITPRFEEICQKMMAKQVADRYASMSAVADDFREFLQTVDSPGGKQRRQKPLLDSIAILPLANVGGDEQLDYLGDGITESLINTMSRLESLRVMARSTVFRYKGVKVDAVRVGQELGVGSVLIGEVAFRGDRLVVNAELVNARDGSQLWGKSFKRQAADILDLDETIAGEIASGLQLRLSADQRQQLGIRKTEIPAAYEQYLKGRFHWNKRTADDLNKAIRCFRSALAEDPVYAQAYAGLADSFGLLIAWGDSLPHDTCPMAKQMANQALAIDDSLADAHTSLGYLSVVYDWDWPQAEQRYRRAIELNPGYANAHHWLAYLLMCWRRFDEAEQSLHRALQLDPLSLIISANLGLCRLFAKDVEAAISQIQSTIAMDANLASAHYYLGLAYSDIGEYGLALDALQRSIELSGEVPGELGAVGYAHARMGDEQSAQDVITRLESLATRGYSCAFHIGLIQVGLGTVDEAFRYFEQAADDRDFYMIYLGVDSRLDSIRKHERFMSLARRVGIPVAFGV